MHLTNFILALCLIGAVHCAWLEGEDGNTTATNETSAALETSAAPEKETEAPEKETETPETGSTDKSPIGGWLESMGQAFGSNGDKDWIREAQNFFKDPNDKDWIKEAQSYFPGAWFSKND